MGGHVHAAPIAWWVGVLGFGDGWCIVYVVTAVRPSSSFIIVVNLIIMLGQAEYSTHLERRVLNSVVVITVQL